MLASAGPLAAAMAGMKRALLQAAEATAAEQAKRRSDAEAWDSLRAQLANELQRAQHERDDLASRAEAMTRQLESFIRAVRKADGERDAANARAIAAETHGAEVIARAQADVEAARSAVDGAVAETRAASEALQRDREVAWARERETLTQLAADARRKLEDIDAVNAEATALLQQRHDALVQQMAGLVESSRRLDAELQLQRGRVAELEAAHPLAIGELKSAHAVQLADALADLLQKHDVAVLAEVQAREAAERRAAASQSELEARERSTSELRAKVAALEAVLSEAQAFNQHAVLENAEHIAVIRADCEAKVELVHREASRDIERANEGLESIMAVRAHLSLPRGASTPLTRPPLRFLQNAVNSVAEAQHALQDFKDKFASEVEKARAAFEVQKAELLAHFETEKQAIAAQATVIANRHIDSAEEDFKRRLASKEDELSRSRENLENVSKAFRSECEKVTALEAELYAIESRQRASVRKGIFGTASASAEPATGSSSGAGALPISPTAAVPVAGAASPPPVASAISPVRAPASRFFGGLTFGGIAAVSAAATAKAATAAAVTASLSGPSASADAAAPVPAVATEATAGASV